MNNFFKPAYLLTVVAAVGGGFFLGSFFTKNNSAKITSGSSLQSRVKDIRESGYRYVNPLLDCEQSQDTFTELSPFKDKIESFVKEIQEGPGKVDFVSVYFRDLNNGPWIGINESETFSPASLLKVPLMMAYYKLAESNPEILNQKITVTTLAQLIPNQQFIIPSVRLEVGKTYTVAELMERMIKYSDNDSAQLLITNIDLKTLSKVYKDFDLNLPTNNQPETQVTVHTYAGFFRMLFNASYLSKDNSEKALETLIQAEFKDGLVAGVPKNITVAHKFGERITDDNQIQLHDCGIMYYPNKPYLLCVMTRGQDEQQLAKVIKDVSTLVYQKVDAQIGDDN